VNEPKRVSLIWVILMALAVAVIVFDVAYGDDEIIQSNDMNSNNMAQTAGSVSTGGNRALALSGSDMAIRDCLATHSLLFGLWQGTHTNPYCEAVRMDLDGNFLAAAEMRCSTKKYRKTYGKGQECIDAVIRSAPPAPAPLPAVEDDDDEDEWREEQVAMQIDYDERIAQLEQTIADTPATTVTREVVKERYLSDKQRQALAEVLAE